MSNLVALSKAKGLLFPQRNSTSRSFAALRTTVLLACAASNLGAQQPATSAPISAMRYEVTADKDALATRRLHVTTSFDVADDAIVLLSLPAWTPGAYEITNFAKWVSGFHATESGAELRWDKLDYDTWRVRPTRGGRVSMSFDYSADSLDNAMAWTRPDFALFNGTNLFMYPEGRSADFASTVLIKTDPTFLVTTGLAGAGANHTYKAPNYHDLVDNPFFVGRFDLDSAPIAGKTVRYATYPVGSVSAEARATAWEQLKRVIPVEVNVFGEAPWDNYTVMQIADSSYQGFSGLEHASSHVDIVSPAGIGTEFQPSLYAHEIFHSWNVKRLRPADMVPYHYDRPQPTTWLWVSEGITDYYADLAEMRGGVVDEAGFFALTAAKIGEIATTIPFALEDASVNTWVHPTDGTEYSYYPKGSLAGLMLDIVVRDASDNKRSLDTIMRELYETTYKKGRGFTHDDFWGAVSRAAGGKSFDDFEQKYVGGRDSYPWPAMLKLAGMRLVPDSVPRIGVTTAADPAGAIRVVSIDSGSTAALSGVRPGDELVSIGDIAVNDAEFGAKFRLRYAGRPSGSPLPIVVKRGIETITLRGALAYAANSPRVSEDPAATPKAIRVRTGILRGTLDR
jgi:predicted metalloprotease with PDZ domain